MIEEVLSELKPRNGGRYLDGTFGAGGYTAAILEAADCRVWAIDRDPKAIADAAPLVKKYSTRLTVIEGKFGDMASILKNKGVDKVDGVALDLGVSSMQLDDADRGFSFRYDGPLDMRQGQIGLSAADLVNDSEESALADIIYKYGEERQARRIARAIVKARANKPIMRTGQLADIVRSTYRGGRRSKTDPATRTFQAIRIQVNEELDELKRGLEAAEVVLAPGGRLAVVAFHSLEDRMVKEFLRKRSGELPTVSRHLPEVDHDVTTTFKLVHRGALKPADRETRCNPRARSARLRLAERTSALAQGC
jgi:16S rRNA (cytosine1402-N4)-methyltransferase